MPIPEPVLDDLKFQSDLVDEARRRIIRYCPEWTDYNLSDPGITLIELFAWMTEMIVYRLNRVPEKNYIRFMELMGIRLQSASSAKAELTFKLSTQFPVAPDSDTYAVVPRWQQVATLPVEDEPEIIFTTDKRLVIIPPKLAQLRRDADFHKNYLPRLGIETFNAFQRRPQMGDTFYLGFDEEQDVSGHILKLDFETEGAQATGVKRNDPPLIWEASIGDDMWEELPPSTRPDEKDTTGGLNNPSGSLVLYLPLEMRTNIVNGRNGYWVRCRLEQRRREQGMYTQSPQITNVQAFALGATTTGTHAVFVEGEILGQSDGEPNQTFQLKNAPILDLAPDETVEIEEKLPSGDIVYIPWKRVESFATSDRFDRDFTIDTATGQVAFGPAVRQTDGSIQQYGRVPQANRRVRMTRYRHGGGVIGNVGANQLQVLKSSVPYVSSVFNMKRAYGGRDAETVDEAKLRAQRELRAQHRSVTGEDFENLAKAANRSIARVKCKTPSADNPAISPGTIELLVVPAAFDSLKVGDLTKLQVDQEVVDTVAQHLDNYRLMTTTLRIREPRYIGVKVKAEIVISEYAAPEVVISRVKEAINNFITPLALTDPDNPPLEGLEGWEGWPFGRDLYVSELYTLIQNAPGVKHVLDVQLRVRDVVPSNEEVGDDLSPEEALRPDAPGQSPIAPPQMPGMPGMPGQDFDDEDEEEEDDGLTPVEERRYGVPDDALLVPLSHDIEIVDV